MMSPAKFASAASPASAAGDFSTQAGNPDFVLSLAGGFRVIKSFEGHYEGRSISEISQSTGLSRASIRRLCFTLELLGYAERSRQVYNSKPIAVPIYTRDNRVVLPSTSAPTFRASTAKHS